MVLPLPPSPLVALVAKVDEERAAAGATDGEDLTARHKELVRAAGRAAIEETLQPTARSELTPETLAAEWLAYAEVFGTNGMAAGSARLSSQPGIDAQPQSSPAVAEPCNPGRRTLIGASIAVGVAVLVGVLVAARHQSRAVSK